MAGSTDQTLQIHIAGRADGSLNAAVSTAQKALSGLGKIAGTIAKTAAVAVGAATTAAVGFAKSAVEKGMEFDSSMSQVAATMGTTVDQIGDLRDLAMEMGASTAFSATQAAEALNYMALAGYDAETSAAMLPNVLNLAAAGGVELGEASDMVTDAQSALGLTIEQTTAMVDQMAQTASKSNTSVAQLGEAILTVGGTAQYMAGGTTELNAVLGVLADNGIKGSEGGTHLRNMLLKLASPTADAQKLLDQLDVSVFDTEGNMRSFAELFPELNAAMSTMTDQEKLDAMSTLFNSQDIASATALLGTSVERWDELSNSIQSAWYSMDSLNESLSKTGIDLTAMQGNLNKLGISGETFSKILGESGGNAESFADALWEAADSGVSYSDIVDALGGNLADLQTAFDETSGAAQQMADTRLDNLEGDITLWKSALEGAQIVLSDQLTPNLREFVQFGTKGLSEVTEAFQEGGLQGAMQAMGGVLGDAVNMVVDMLPGMVDAGMQLLGALGQGIIDNLPTIIDAAVEIVLMLASGILQGLPHLGAAALQIIQQLANGITTHLPELVAMGKEFLTQLADGARTGIPELITTVVGLIPELTAGLLALLPDIINAGMGLIQGLADGIIQAIPILISYLPELITQIVGFLTTSLPQILEQGVIILQNIAMGIIQAIPQLVAQLPTIIQTICDFVTQNLPTIINQGVNLLINLAMGIIQAIPQLVAQLPQIISSICTTLAQNLPQIITAGIEILTNLADGLIGAIPTLVAQLPQIVSAILEGIGAAVTGVFEIGSNIVKGVWDGICAMGSWIKEKVSGFFSGIVDGVKSTLGIHSPSTVFAGIGGYMAEGLGEGWSDEYAAVKNGIEDGLNFDAGTVGIDTAVNAADAPTVNSEAQQQASAAQGAPTAQAQQAAKTPQPAPPETPEPDGGEPKPGPLSSLWNQVQGMAANAVGTAKDWIGNALDTFTGGGDDNSQTYTDNSQQPIQISYSPQYTFTGGSPTKDDLVEAERMSQDEFSRMANQWLKEISRTSLKGALV